MIATTNKTRIPMMRISIGPIDMGYPFEYSYSPEPSPRCSFSIHGWIENEQPPPLLIRTGSLMAYVTSASMGKPVSSTGSMGGGWPESCAVTVAQRQVEPGEEEHRHDAAADERPNAEARHRRLLSLVSHVAHQYAP